MRVSARRASRHESRRSVPHVLGEDLLALLAAKGHDELALQLVRLGLGVALGAVEPLATTRRANRDLGVQDVLAHDGERERVRAGGVRGSERRKEG